MKKRSVSLVLAGALALSLTACAPAGEKPGSAPSPTVPPPESSVQALATPSPEPTPTPEPSAPPVTADFDLPDRDYQPWQWAYMEFLTLLQTDQTTWEPGGWGELVGSECYSLYDVDKDGVPELFVKYGDCEAAFIYKCYAFRNGQVLCVGEFAGGHSSLYTHPDKNAVLRSEGHMGYKEVYEYPMEGGVLTEEREIFSEEDVREYTPTGEIVPGAQYIECCYTQLGEWQGLDHGRPHPSAGKALLLPICDCGVGPAATGSNSEQARAAILAALNGDTELCGASGDHFYGDTGPVAWAEYIQPNVAYPYNDVPLEVTAHAWQDMNGDGQEECLLRLWWPGYGDGGGYVVVLSEQEGTVYAYFFGFYDRSEFWTDGMISDTYDGSVRLSFWKEQCYSFAVPEVSGQPVKWVDGSPAG